ncbi:PQ-loop repeat-containing protein [Paenibacillus agilis]|nr:PQ-loop repeat-containing protein [Paenibacillus agilis]
MDSFLLDIVPMLATIFLTICYFPQIVKNYKTKDVSSMSMPFWILLIVAISLLTVNAFVIFIKFGTFGYLVTEILNLALAVTVLAQVIIYRKKKK